MSDSENTEKPRRPSRTVWLALTLSLVALLCWQVFQLGAVRGALEVGERLDDRAELLALQDRSFVIMEQQDRKIESLMAQLDTQRKLTDLELQAGAEMQRELQSSLAERRQLLERIQFYESIIGNEASQSGLRVAAIRLRPTDAPNEWLLEVTLTQVKKHTSRLLGKVSVAVLGDLNGEYIELGQDKIHPKKLVSQRFGFRYYQTLSVPLVLPEDFVASELVLDVKVHSPRKLQLTEQREWVDLLR